MQKEKGEERKTENRKRKREFLFKENIIACFKKLLLTQVVFVKIQKMFKFDVHLKVLPFSGSRQVLKVSLLQVHSKM